MSDKAISTSRLARLNTPTGTILTFCIYHPECFAFPTKYLEFCARHRQARYYQWEGCFGCVGRTIRVVPLSTVAIWAKCDECWEPMRPAEWKPEGIGVSPEPAEACEVLL